MNRFFVESSSIQDDKITITGPQCRQIHRVLRLRPGDGIVALDNTGWQYRVALKGVSERAVHGTIEDKSPVTTEPRTQINLYQSLIRPAKFEYVLQKGTELGMRAFIPVVSERCLVNIAAADKEAKLIRWRHITREAAEQSGRGLLPLLHPPMPLDAAFAQSKGLSLLPWEGERALGIGAALRTHPEEGEPLMVNLFIGPEGGFTEAEVDSARRQGILPVSLGPRILRAETAGLVAAAAILYERGDLGG